MGRTPVGRTGARSNRRTLDVLVMVGGAIVLLFAVVGVATAGKYVADKASGTSKTATPRATNTGATSVAAINRAHAQATAIVNAAQQSGKAVVSQAARRAHKQANQIVAQARTTAARTVASAASRTSRNQGTSRTGSAASGTTGAPSGTTSGTTGTGSTGTGTYSTTPSTGQVAAVPMPAPTYAAPQSATRQAVASPLQSTPVGAPNLSNVPQTWLVVGYNATFGHGPGSAGSVSVVNRSRGPFSGTVKVVYTHGGVAYASFRGLAAGQSLVLPLNGPVYTGGGFSIQVVV